MTSVRETIMRGLKPCPFCGNAYDNYLWAHDPLDGMRGMIHAISCSQCGSDGPPGSSLRSAASLWNARPAPDGTPPKYMQKLNANKEAFEAKNK